MYQMYLLYLYIPSVIPLVSPIIPTPISGFTSHSPVDVSLTPSPPLDSSLTLVLVQYSGVGNTAIVRCI